MSEKVELWQARIEAHIAVALAEAEHEAIKAASALAEKEASRVFVTGGEDAEAYRDILRELWERGMGLWERQMEAQRRETEAYNAYSDHLSARRAAMAERET